MRDSRPSGGERGVVTKVHLPKYSMHRVFQPGAKQSLHLFGMPPLAVMVRPTSIGGADLWVAYTTSRCPESTIFRAAGLLDKNANSVRRE